MAEASLLVTPVPAKDETSRDISVAGRELRSAFELQGVVATPCMLTYDAVHASCTYLGESIELARAVLPPVSAIICVWLQARRGRKVRFKSEDLGLDIEAQTPEDVKKLLQMVQGHQKKLARHSPDEK